MKPRYPYARWLRKVFGVLLPGALAFLNPPVARAQDRILPLKIKVGEKAPDFEPPSANGKTVKLSDYAGQNVLIDFYRWNFMAPARPSIATARAAASTRQR